MSKDTGVGTETVIPESPQVNEPATTPAPDTIDEKQLLTDALNDLGVKTVDQLEGMSVASSQAGRLANIVGDLKDQNKELKRLIENQNQAQTRDNDYYNEPQTQQVDLKREMKGVIQEVIQEQQTAHQQSIMAANHAMSAVRSNEDYRDNAVVREVFEQRINAPDVILKLNQGLTTPEKEFNNVLITYYKKVATNSANAVNKIQKDNTINPPHMEGNQAATNTPPEPDERYENIKKIKENMTGSDSDIRSLLDQFLPAGDPLLRP